MTNNTLSQSKLVDFIKFYTSITFSLFIVTLALRFFELTQMVWVKPLSDNSFNAELIGVISDISDFSFVAIVILGIGLLFSWNKIAYKSVISTLSIIYIIINLSTVLFFLTALVPMDQSMFTYSISEMIVIVKSTQLGITGILFIICPFIIFAGAFSFLKKKNMPIWLAPSLFFVGWIVASPLSSYFINNEGNLHNKRIALNKADFFIEKSIKHFFKEEKTENVEKNINESVAQKKFLQYRKEDSFYKKTTHQNNIPQIKEASLEQFPFLHQNEYDPLNGYFNNIEKKPNVVFIIVESLGQRFFDKKRDPICFVPFLDSLKNNSLYWNNCFSSSERTFGVLPSVLGSLPYGEKGFNELLNMPEHLSLTTLLKGNGYHSSFFYGGWIGFHGMERLLKKQQFDFLSYYYPSTYKRLAKDNNGFSWGYADHIMMDRSYFVIDSLQQSPMLNVYLTLSTHSPFDIPNRDLYEQKIKNKLKTAGQKEKHEMILKNPEPFISAAYLDDCIKNLFAEYKKRGLYDNTIFVITGDHVMHELGIQSESEVYNVPLIIHSPLLQKTGHFTAVNSHHDIAPSLINLLVNNKVIKTPKTFNWMGYGLELNNEQNNKFIPLMQNNKEIKACVYKNHFYSTSGELYKFQDAQYPIKTDNEKVKTSMENRLSNFKEINQYTCLNNFICPFDLAYYNKPFKLISQKELFDHKDFNKEEYWESEKITLDTSYNDIVFDISLNMFFTDTIPNPNIGIKIYDKNQKYLDYFFLKNEIYTSSKHDINKTHSFHITRSIKNEKMIFDQGNEITFFIEKSNKEFLIKKFKMSLKGLK